MFEVFFVFHFILMRKGNYDSCLMKRTSLNHSLAQQNKEIIGAHMATLWGQNLFSTPLDGSSREKKKQLNLHFSHFSFGTTFFSSVIVLDLYPLVDVLQSLSKGLPVEPLQYGEAVLSHQAPASFSQAFPATIMGFKPF